MYGPPTGYWAKLEPPKHERGDNPVTSWHPLVDHCADVAACLTALLEVPTIRHRLARLAGLDDLSPGLCARLGYLAGLHDVGKANNGFQNKALPHPPFVAGHVKDLLSLFGCGYEDQHKLVEALDLATVCEWAGSESVPMNYLYATICHHGNPVEVGVGYRPEIWRTIGNRDPFAEIQRIRYAVGEWFPEACSPDTEDLPDAPALQHAYNGLLTLADWIGSDAANFPFSEPKDPPRFRWALERARKILVQLNLAADHLRPAMDRRRDPFARISSFDPRPLQRAVADLPVPSQGGIAVLEAETGSGKTEAALARFAALFEAGAVDGMYFALPTRTAATQIHQRVVEAVQRAFPDEHQRPAVVLAVPGYVAVVDRQQGRLEGRFEWRWDDVDANRFRYRSWAVENSKRYLAGCVVVGTVDQVLMASLRISHSHMRGTALLRHLLIVDEVHASDTYMNALLRTILQRHLQAGGHALLMSATLGSATRSALMHPDRRVTYGSLESEAARAYPLLLHRDATEDSSDQAGVPASSTKKIAIEFVPIAADPEDIARRAIDAARTGARVLVIRNLVAECIETQSELERLASGPAGDCLMTCRGIPAPHHGRYAPGDRRLLDAAVEDAFGRRSSRTGCVAVATQTVQQILDIDADLILTDLCPMDVLLQRFGRLHRHPGRRRPAAFVEARAIIVVSEDRNLGRLIGPAGKPGRNRPHGYGSVYENLTILEATWQLLEKHRLLTIPEDNRMLVEHATHPDALREMAERLGNPWPLHHRHMLGILLARGNIAGLNTCVWTVPYDWTNPQPILFGRQGEVNPEIRTRLGLSDRRVVFEHPLEGPFGATLTEISLPHHLAPNADNVASPTNVTAHNDTIRFQFGPHRFLYDRLGLRRIPDGMEDADD